MCRHALSLVGNTDHGRRKVDSIKLSAGIIEQNESPAKPHAARLACLEVEGLRMYLAHLRAAGTHEPERPPSQANRWPEVDSHLNDQAFSVGRILKLQDGVYPITIAPAFERGERKRQGKRMRPLERLDNGLARSVAGDLGCRKKQDARDESHCSSLT